MPFDPSQPFEEVSGFDPSKPFQEVGTAVAEPPAVSLEEPESAQSINRFFAQAAVDRQDTPNMAGMKGAWESLVHPQIQIPKFPDQPTETLPEAPPQSPAQLSVGGGFSFPTTQRKADPVTAGLYNAAAGLAEFFTSPIGIATAGLSSLPASVGKVAGAAFAVDLSRSLPELAQGLSEAVKSGNTQKAVELGASGVVQLAAIKGGVKHAVGEGIPVRAPKPEIIPEQPFSTNEGQQPIQISGEDRLSQIEKELGPRDEPIIEDGKVTGQRPVRGITTEERNLLEQRANEPVTEPAVTLGEIPPSSGTAPPEVRPVEIEEAAPDATKESLPVAESPVGGSAEPVTPEAAPQVPQAEVTPENPVVGFTTAKGSEYTIDESGNTTRLKKSAGLRQGEVHEKLPVVFVTPEVQDAIMQSGQSGERIILGERASDGTWKQIRPEVNTDLRGRTLAIYTLDRTTGTTTGSHVVSTTPAVGSHPFEIGYERDKKTFHMGNKIVELKYPEPVRAENAQGEPTPPITESAPVETAASDAPNNAAKAKVIADRLRARFKTPGDGNLYSFGPIPKVIDAAVEVAAQIIEAGGKAADAIEAAVKYVRDNHKGPFDEFSFRGRMETATGETHDPSELGIKNSVNDQDRINRGLEPIEKRAAQALGVTWEEADKRIQDNPNAGPELVKQILDNPRLPQNEVDQAVLLRHRVKLENDIHREQQRAFGDNAPEEGRATAELEMAKYLDQLNDLEKAESYSGTTAGRTLNFRRQLAKEDYSLTRVLGKARLKKGEALSREEIADLTKQSDAWAESQKEIERLQAEESVKKATADAEKARQDAIAAAQKQPSTRTATRQPSRQALIDVLDKHEQAALDRISKSGVKFGSGSGFEHLPNIRDYAIVYASRLAKGTIKIAEYMKETFGPGIQKHLKAIREEAIKIKAEMAKEANAIPQVGDVDKKGTIEAIIAGAKEAHAEKEDISRYARKIAENFIKSEAEKGRKHADITGDEITKAVHDTLKEVDPSISLDKSRDLWTLLENGAKAATKDAVKRRLIEASDEEAKLSNIKRMQGGENPKARGQQRVPVTELGRQRTSIINELKKQLVKLGIIVTDPAAQLKSALDALHTRQKNRIADLRYENSTRTRIVRDKTSLKYDEEGLKNQAEIDRLKKENHDIFGDRTITDEERLNRATASAERAEVKANQDLELAKKGVFPENKSKTPPSAKLDAIRARATAAREQVRLLRESNDAFKEKKAADELAKVEAQAAEIQRQINEGDLAVSPKAPLKPGSPEFVKAQAELAELRKIKAKLQSAQKRPSPSEVEVKQLADLDTKIEAVIIRINNGDISTQARAGKPVSAEKAAKQAELAELNKVLNQLRNAAKPKRSPEEIALQSAKTRAASRKADLLDQLARMDAGDFSKPSPKTPAAPNADLRKAMTENANLKRQIDKKLYQYELDNRTKPQRIADLILRIRREFVISGLSAIFNKLPAYSAFRFAERPLHEVVAAGIAHIPGFRDVASRAPDVARGSIGSNVKAMIGDYRDAFTKGIKDAKDAWTKGESELKTQYDPSLRAEGEFRTFFGTLHQMEKSPLIRFTFERSFRRRLDFAVEHGEDISDPSVLAKHGALAYADGLTEALVNRNELVKKVNRFVESLAEKNKVTNRESGLGKAARFAFKLENPVLHVPLNYVSRTMEYVFGGIYGLGEVGAAKWRMRKEGIESLSTEEGNQIIRHLTKGAIGNAAILTGFLLPQVFGGLSTPNRDKKNPLKPGEAKIGGTTIPASALHNQLANAFNFGATLRTASDSKIKKSDKEPQGLSAGAMAAFWGLVDEAPYAREMSDYVKARDPRQSGTFWGNKVKGYVVPGAISQTAQFFDKDAQGNPIVRKPTTVLEHIKTGIPGLRQQVPAKP